MTTLLLIAALFAQPDKKGFATTREAMQKVQLVIGEWTGSGAPEGVKETAWAEKASWNFKIEKDVYSLLLTVTDGKLMKEGHLTYDLKKKVFRFELTRPDKSKVVYEGKLDDTQLLLEEVQEKDAEQERLEFHLLRENRYFYNVERRRAGSKSWELVCNVGYKKEGVPFVRGEGPKCVITGGAGTISLQYKDKTYYVC